MLDPVTDPARLRAFFIRPGWSRRGIGKAMVAACESAIIATGFSNAELVATLGGEPLYLACGYREIGRSDCPGRGGTMLPCVRMGKQLR